VHIHVVGVDHLSAPLPALASLTTLDELVDMVMNTEPGVTGAVLVTTCNRVDLAMDVAYDVPSGRLLDVVRTSIKTLVPDADTQALDGLRALRDDDAIRYLFEVGAGLRSAVIGDKQVIGQLRRAYEQGADKGQCTARLHRLFHSVLRSSRQVAATTSLGAVGRSAAEAGLDLALDGASDLTGWRVLLVGTGDFAGVTVAELVGRGAEDILCWSASGRAPQFAAHHRVQAVPDGRLIDALRAADLVVTCSGNGAVIDATSLLAARPEVAEAVSTQLPMLDLSLGGDIETSVGDLPGVRLVRLQDVGSRTAPSTSTAIAEAEQVVTQWLADHLAKERSREADPLVTALREHAVEVLEDELSRVRSHESAEVAEAVERSLRHVIGVILHTPIVRVAQLAEQGRLEDCRNALDVLFGLEVAA
jgi:glutamyl-tRNA reductase